MGRLLLMNDWNEFGKRTHVDDIDNMKHTVNQNNIM
jgi:hypothetical protein